MSDSAQLELGDPAGNCTAEYWDSWFDKVSKGNRFEWYCNSTSLLTILKQALQNTPHPFTPRTNILHVGTGNSELIFDLTLNHGVVVKGTAVDISNVAIDEMNIKKSVKINEGFKELESVEFIVCDVLQELPFDDNSFDAFIDKGLIDAMFCNHSQSSLLDIDKIFVNSHEKLKGGAPYVCVSLAEEHVIHLLIHVLMTRGGSGRRMWNCLSVYEINPEDTKSSLRPFAFVLHKCGSADENNDGEAKLDFIYADSDEHDNESHTNPTFDTVNALISESRLKYAAFVTKLNSKEQVRMALATIEIKPYEAETDLEQIYNRLKSSASITEQFSTKITFKEYSIEPIGFGISKLVVKVVIAYEDIDEFVRVVEEEEEDSVQSVDVDYDSTEEIRL